jgi:shikimate kinase/3-dehydroquinate synthase
LSDREPPKVKRILLVGFMGSGKTEVGQALAERLGWSFKDFDQEIRSRVGLPIPRIFREHGEDFFRQMEERVGAELLKEERVVLASGGGWAGALGRMEDLPPGTVSVWLKVSAEEAVRRARQEGPTRPLLAVPDAVGRARELLDQRTPQYSKADLEVDSTDSTPGALAEAIEHLLNETGSLGGLPSSPYM